MELIKIAIKCREDKKGELLRTCQSITEQTCHETGCLQSRIIENGDDDNFILLEQQWKLWADLNSYFSSDHFRAMFGAMKLLGESYEIHINGIAREVPGDLAGVNRNEKQVESA